MTDVDSRLDHWIGRTAYDPSGNKVGRIEDIYVDDATGRPEWLAVTTGLFGTRHSFVPLQGAEQQGDDLILSWDKSVVKDAPNVEMDGHLSDEEVDRLHAHYGMAGRRTSDVADTAAVAGGSGNGHDTSGPTTDDAMTRSEERVRVDTEAEVVGRARLRKWVETEHQTITVPVRKEKVRLETEPITDANVGRAMSGPDLSSEEHEVVLTEERPVIEKEVVPVERVRLETDVEVVEETVGTDVRKERIELDEDTTGRTTR